ncbi:hypothetical protein PRIPAC_82511, partial [Pristionchus pacificus]
TASGKVKKVVGRGSAILESFFLGVQHLDQAGKFLSQYEIKTIPAIRLVDSTGSVVSDNIRIQIENCDTG